MGGIRHKTPLPGERLLQPSSMWLNDSASRRASTGPSGSILVESSPASTAPATVAIRRTGRVLRPATSTTAISAANERDGAGHEEGPGHARLGGLDG